MKLGKLDKSILHFIGNKTIGDGVKLSNSMTEFNKVDEYISELIIKNFKFDELHHFTFKPSLDLNPTFQFIKSIFENSNTFIDQSQNIGRYLYDKSTHPQIKAGELCVLYFKDCSFKGEVLDAICLLKSENKDVFLEIERNTDGFEIDSKKGININKLDKGCLIFNTQKEKGYLVSIVDNTNRSNAQYWGSDFLGVKLVENDFYQTNQFLDITKQFIKNQLSQEFEIAKADKIDLLNRSVDYFKNNNTFKKDDFENEVLTDENLINSFNKFDEMFCQENNIKKLDNFDISKQAVKKQARIFKSVLKLDKNFHIYIHGDREMIEQGIDSDGRKFYKLYYNEES
ncbi:MAG: hypothetical protein CSB06_02865 [Bacteroidia bacterium]|nr:MAG: hypothetical protein CSB06_02865 [Bacteroidia bacterium]